MFREQRRFFLGILEVPVHVVELELAELHMFSIGVQEAPDDFHAAVGREAEMADAAVFFLFQQIVADSVFRVEIGVDIPLVDIVEQVEVEVGRLAFLQLPLEDFFHLVHVGEVVAREFAGEIIALSGIPVQIFSGHQLGIAAVVPPCRVEVVDAVLIGIVNHLRGSGFVHFAVFSLQHGQAHHAKPKAGKL